MPFITREDGERFIIPSYRDVITTKKTALRREILALSDSYGQYITLQRKGIDQYEVAFSDEPGYLLGESVWHYFKRPNDLIYCEQIPNTTEAILVIVKSGSVYLDGPFAFDSIPDELIALRTQQLKFEIYIYGDVPISNVPEEGKFVFDSASVKSFTELDKPVFPTLPLVKTFQLQLVDVVLQEKGIGVFPLGKIIGALLILGLLWVAWTFLTSPKKEEYIPQVMVRAANPYQAYINAMIAPHPTMQIDWMSNEILLLMTIPGWYPYSIEYTEGNFRVGVKSMGAKTPLLYEWANKNSYRVEVMPEGLYLTTRTRFPNRNPPTTINPLNQVVTTLLDSLAFILPGNSLSVGTLVPKYRYFERQLIINFSNITPGILDLVGQKLENLPLVLLKVSITIMNGSLTGSITLKALGS